MEAFNVCSNWGLRCYEMRQTDKAVVLKSTMNRKNKDGEYTTPIYIDVVCSFDHCEITEDDYAKSFINVDGTFSVSDYTNKEGKKVPTMTIFATKVTKKVFDTAK